MKYLKSFLTAGCIAALTWGMSGCGDKDEPTLQSFKVEPPSVSLMEGREQQLSIVTVPKDFTGVTFNYVSANPTVATVSESGLVKAMSAGETVITVSAPNVTAVKVPVTVGSSLHSISIAPEEVSLSTVPGVGESTQQLTVTALPDGLSGVSYSYVSSNPDVATVSTAGLVTAVAAGETEITVTGTLEGVTVTAARQVTVSAIDAELNRSAWTAEATDVLDNNVAGYMFDGDLNTIWHSNTTDMPHGFTVDMHGYKNIGGFYYYNRRGLIGADRQYPDALTIETSVNGTDWTQVYAKTGGFEIKEARIVLQLSQPIIARYFKVTVTAAAHDAPYTYFAEMGIYNDNEPLSTPAIFLNAPTENLTHSIANPLTFSWEADDPAPASYTLKISKNQNMTGAMEFTVQGTSKEVTAAELESILGADAKVTVYWSASADGATSPTEPKTFILAKLTLLEGVLVNAKQPFTGVQNNPDGAGIGEQWWERDRLMQLDGWTHNNALVSWSDRNNDGTFICIMAYPPAGGDMNWTNNSKVYQTVNLEAGNYALVFHFHHTEGGLANVYGVVTTDNVLPDHTAVTSDANVLGYTQIQDTSPNTDYTVPFTVQATGNVTIGWVYNTENIGHPYVFYYMSGIDLYKL
jgi:hypothetical protein